MTIGELRKQQYPHITDAECARFEQHATEGAQVDNGEGVLYSVIQPYDLVRFCRTVKELRAALKEAEREVVESARAAVIEERWARADEERF